MLYPNAAHVSTALAALALMTCYFFDVNALGVGVAAAALCVALKAVERTLRRREHERKTIEILENDTRRLITNFLLDFVGVFHRKKKSEAHSTMKKVVKDFIEIDRHYGNGMTSYVVASELRLDERGDDMSFVAAAANTLFGACPTTTTWEHVATLLFFGALVCQDLMRERESQRGVELVGREISTYLLSHHRDWLLRNNSWDGFVDHFQKSFRYDFKKDQESCICH